MKQSFVRDLEAIERHASGDRARVSVEEIEVVLQGRGFATLCMILCIPFIQPIPLPGLSVVFGTAIMAMGLRLALGTVGSLPQFVKKRELDAGTLRKIVRGAAKVFTYAERFFKPRLDVMLRPPMVNMIGVSIFCSGLALSLPLPPIIICSNSFPAWSIIFSCLGYLERDGLFVLAGKIAAIATWVYFAFWSEVIRRGLVELWAYLG